MSQALFRFHGDLDFFLPQQVRFDSGDAVPFAFDPEHDGRVTVKHAVEALGIPHPEVDRLRANGQDTVFDYRLRDGDVVDVCAWTPKPDFVTLRPPLPRPVRFVLDTHLGRLAAYLRLLGCDALYDNTYDDAQLAMLSQEEGRVLLTRDRGLLKRSIVDFGYCVRSTEPKQQLIDVVRHYRLAGEASPWRRCLRCNARLQPVDKREILDRLEPKTKRYYDDFRQCENCGQIYWAGSHHARMQTMIDDVLAAADQTAER